MFKSILTYLLLLITYTTYAQNFEDKFGRVGFKDFEFVSYDKDPDAEAVILFDIGKSKFIDSPEGYDIEFTRTKRIKIFDRSALDYAKIEIPFYEDGYGKMERVTSIEAYTYNVENGAIVKKALSKNAVFEKEINERWKSKNFVFPDVKEGSIIEYKYVFETPFQFNLPDWDFQDRIPTIYSEYTVGMIPFYEYSFIAQGLTKFDYQKSYESKDIRSFGSINKSYGINMGNGVEFHEYVHTYVMKNVPAFKDEDYITSIEDYIMKIDFQLSKINLLRGGTKEIITTWPKLNEELIKNKYFGKYQNASEKAAAKILSSDLDISNLNDNEKARKIIDYVKTGFVWDKFYSKYASKTPKELLNQKTGNSADINLFLCSMLNASGIKATPILLSTRDHGRVKVDYPYAHFFNYVIVLVETQNPFLADGTDSHTVFNRLPVRCINERGLLVREGESSWVNLENGIISHENANLYISLDPNNLSATTRVNLQTTEYDSYVYKNLYANDTLKLKKRFLDVGFKTVDHLQTFNYEKNNATYVIGFDGTSQIERINDKIVVSPFLGFPPKENKLTQEKRSYPVDMIYAQSTELQSTINIPEGYKVSFIPEKFSISSDLAEVKIEYKLDKDYLEANAVYSFKKPVYQPNEYDRIKYYFKTIVKKFNEQIILEPIDSNN